jgi:hypothetical protein
MAFGKLRTNMRFWKTFYRKQVLLLPPVYNTYMASAMANCGTAVLLARAGEKLSLGLPTSRQCGSGDVVRGPRRAAAAVHSAGT